MMLNASVARADSAKSCGGEASVTAWARVLRENHRDHAGKPPPRRQQDREVLIP